MRLQNAAETPRFLLAGGSWMQSVPGASEARGFRGKRGNH